MGPGSPAKGAENKGVLDPARELEWVIGRPDASPPTGFLEAGFTVTCPGNAEQVLARGREVKVAVLGHSQPWPELDEWKQILPGWFVAACIDDRVVQTCVLDRWSLRAWLHWLRPENRRWHWWAAVVEEPLTLRLTVLAREPDFLRGSLDWLLQASGATNVQTRQTSEA